MPYESDSDTQADSHCQPSAQLARRRLLRATSAMLLAGLGAGAVQPLRADARPAGLDMATQRLSERGLYRVSYKPDAAPLPINRLHSWILHVETADARPVVDAQVQVDGDMPEHRHGLPTRPRVTRYLGNGDYLVEGLRFQMGGWWVMAFTVTENGRSDVAKFNLMLQK
ncbi:FixH family protein [Ramlibacter sp. 2FC]|uniref:FixH family protein n=1 Tax=Ramlibacter sp. 2FC TaxID=2502188 RepID=UPI0010F53278|nr:FixH family protein [Ramlibacter sp. 2FC]